MNRLRQLINLSSTGAALALGTAMALVIVSCSTSPTNPVSPSATTPDATAAGGGAIVTATASPTVDPTPSPSPGNCTAGYYKTHAIDNPGNQPNVWYGASFGFCDNGTQPSCADLLDDLRNSPGPVANAAAAYLNSVTGFVCH